MNTTMDTLVINIQSTTNSATQSIGKLISSLKRLQKELDNTISKSKGLSSLKNIDANIKKPSNFTKKFNQKVNTDTPGLNDQLKMRGINLDDGSWKTSSVFKSLNTETTKYKNNLGQVAIVTKKTKNNTDSYNVSLRTIGNTTNNFNRKIKTMGDLLNKTSVKFTAIATGLVFGAKKIISSVEQAATETEALNLYTVSLGENAEKGKEWIKEFSDALYLDPVNVMQYQGSFNSLVEGIGVGSDNAYLMSKNLTQLVYDLSSFKNISIESSYEKLMSGIAGEIEPLILVAIICEYYRKRSEPTNVGCGNFNYC